MDPASRRRCTSGIRNASETASRLPGAPVSANFLSTMAAPVRNHIYRWRVFRSSGNGRCCTHTCLGAALGLCRFSACAAASLTPLHLLLHNGPPFWASSLGSIRTLSQCQIDYRSLSGTLANPDGPTGGLCPTCRHLGEWTGPPRGRRPNGREEGLSLPTALEAKSGQCL
jgi:hypothetical protein